MLQVRVQGDVWISLAAAAGFAAAAELCDLLLGAMTPQQIAEARALAAERAAVVPAAGARNP